MKAIKPLAILLLCGAAVLAQTAPATAPSLADSSEETAIRAAASEFVLTLTQDDLAPARKLFAGSEDDFKVVEQMHSTIVAQKALKAAIAAKFPDSPGAKAGSNDVDPKAIAEKIGHSRVTIDGDTASLSVDTKLRKIDGQWKVIAIVSEPRTRATINRLMPAMTQAINEVTPEIAAGKYATMDEAAKAVQIKMQNAVRAAMAATTGPSTQPARQP